MKQRILRILVVLSALAGCLEASQAAAADRDPAIKHVAGGFIRGEQTNDLLVFKGIPFAAPPTGPNRWRDPQPLTPWAGVRSTTTFAPGCMQPPLPFGGPLQLSEDCLYLNVWAPKDIGARKLPVMVWIYGGGFKGGATSFTDAANLTRRGVIVVSVAYRVGAFGFLAHRELTAEARHGSGNFGLADQIDGLQWVKKNIANFGGDPKNVTIFGESAGAFSVSMLAASPLAKGLFQKGIAQSGASFWAKTRTNRDERLNIMSLSEEGTEAEASLRALGAPSIAAARALPAKDLLRHDANSWPIVDNHIIVGDQYELYRQGRYNNVPIIVGSNAEEGSLFVQRADRAAFEKAMDRLGKFPAILAAYPHETDSEMLKAMQNFYRDGVFGWPAWKWASLQSQRPSGKPIYLYYFDYPGASFMSVMKGPTHASEIPYVFGSVTNPGGEEKRLTNTMMSYWINFARTGNPNGPDLPIWPRFTPRSGMAMYLNPDAQSGPWPNMTQIRAMDEYFNWRRSRP